MTAGINLFRHPTAVIHQNAERMLTRLQGTKLIAVRCGDMVTRIHQLSIDVEPCGLGALQE